MDSASDLTDGTWRAYSAVGGLSSLFCEHIGQDTDGFLWIATADSGACRFDGDEFPFAAKEIEELTQVLHGRADRFLVVYFQGFISLAPLPCISTTLRVTRVRS